MNTPKKRRLRTPPSRLIRPLDVELDTEYSLDECLERLESAQDTGCRPLGWPLHVQIEAADADGIEFSMITQALRGVDCWLIGEIQSASDRSNLVTGQVGLSPDIIWFMAMLIIVPGVAIVTEGPTQSSFFIFVIFLILGSAFWFSALRTRYELIKRLEEIL